MTDNIQVTAKQLVDRGRRMVEDALVLAGLDGRYEFPDSKQGRLIFTFSEGIFTVTPERGNIVSVSAEQKNALIKFFGEEVVFVASVPVMV